MADKVTCRLHGGGINIEFPMFMESFTFGMNFELAEVKNTFYGIRSWGFEPISLDFTLVTSSTLGFETGIDNSSALIKKCESIVKAAIPPKDLDKQGAILGSTITLDVASWFSSEGYIQNVSIDFQGPWTSSGEPNTAEVSLQFRVVMLVKSDTAIEEGGKMFTHRKVFREDFNAFKDIGSK